MKKKFIALFCMYFVACIIGGLVAVKGVISNIAWQSWVFMICWSLGLSGFMIKYLKKREI